MSDIPCSAVANDDAILAAMSTAVVVSARRVVVVAMVCFTRFLVVFDSDLLVTASTALSISFVAASASVPSCATDQV